MVYKVLRLMEYTYPDEFAFQQDWVNWQVPATGAKKWNNNTIRSSIIQYPEREEASGSEHA
jgi:hypothetical protein